MRSAILVAITLMGLAACDGPQVSDAVERSAAPGRSCAPPPNLAVTIPGGTFSMGQSGIYPEEEPVRQRTVRSFRIDPHEVTNRQFATFVKETHYVTVAEKPVDPAVFDIPVNDIPSDMLQPGSAVFTPPVRPSSRYSDWWRYVPGANWRKPYGPDGANAVSEEPVVHLALADMQAYARWAGGRLPTEAEWEYAAKAGSAPSRRQPSGQEANTWQGVFPVVNDESDGFKGIAPVGCFRPNAFGLYDMVGNVWEMTADLYDPQGHNDSRIPSEVALEPATAAAVKPRVMKGGSYLCAPNYCQRYRPAARQSSDPGMGSSNVGFRLVYDTETSS